MSCATFFYGTVVGLEVHIPILVAMVVVGSVCFFAAERELQKRTGIAKITPC